MFFDKIFWNISKIFIILVKKKFLYLNMFLGNFIFIKWYILNRLSLVCDIIKMYEEFINNKKNILKFINFILMVVLYWGFRVKFFFFGKGNVLGLWIINFSLNVFI